MRYITVTTATTVNGNEFKYEVPVGQYETVDEMREDLGEGRVLEIVNAKRKQDTSQGTKHTVRDALENHAPDSPEVQAAVAKAQEDSRAYNFGKGSSGSRGGPTVKQKQALGAAISAFVAENGKFPSQKDQEAIAEELGISL